MTAYPGPFTLFEYPDTEQDERQRAHAQRFINITEGQS